MVANFVRFCGCGQLAGSAALQSRSWDVASEEERLWRAALPADQSKRLWGTPRASRRKESYGFPRTVIFSADHGVGVPVTLGRRQVYFRTLSVSSNSKVYSEYCTPLVG